MWVECWGKQALIFFHQSFPSSPSSPSKTTPAPHFLETMEPVSLPRWFFLIWVFRSHLVVGDWQQKQKMFCFSALYVLLFRTSQLENRWGWWLRRRRKRWNLKIFAGLSQAGRSEVGHLRKWIWGLLSLWVGFYKWWSSGSENQFNKQWSAHLHYLLHICPLICNEQENKKKMWESFESRKSFVSIGDQQSAWSPWWVNIEHWTLNSEQWTLNSEQWTANQTRGQNFCPIFWNLLDYKCIWYIERNNPDWPVVWVEPGRKRWFKSWKAPEVFCTNLWSVPWYKVQSRGWCGSIISRWLL